MEVEQMGLRMMFVREELGVTIRKQTKVKDLVVEAKSGQ